MLSQLLRVGHALVGVADDAAVRHPDEGDACAARALPARCRRAERRGEVGVAVSVFQSLKQAWIKAASLYWRGCVMNLRKGVMVAEVVVVSPPAAAEEEGGWLKRGENLSLMRRGLLCSHSKKTCSSVSSAAPQHRHERSLRGKEVGQALSG